MARVYEGMLDAKGKRFGIVVGRTNELLSTRLLEGALDCLRRHGAAEDAIEVAWVPGAFEVPQVARRMALAGRVDVIVCLAALLRGQTPHFDHLAAEITRGAARVAAETGVPVTNGVLTAESLEQGLERAGAKVGNRGWQGALAGIELARVVDEVGAGRATAAARPRAARAARRGLARARRRAR